MPKRRKLGLVPLGDAATFRDAALDTRKTLRALLAEAPALSLEPLAAADLDKPLERFIVRPYRAPLSQALYRPPGLEVGAAKSPVDEPPKEKPRKKPANRQPPSTAGEEETVAGPHPEVLSARQAVILAHGLEIESVASFLRSGLSVLVLCDKLVVEHLWQRMVQQAALHPVLLDVPADKGGGLMPRSLRQRQLEALKEKTTALKDRDVLVIPHLDLLAGGVDSSLPGEAREIIELLYGELRAEAATGASSKTAAKSPHRSASDRLLLAFADRGLGLSEVLAARFAVRLEITGVPQEVRYPDGRAALVGEALVTRSESEHFTGFDAATLYKNIAGMNPVRLRQAFRYAVQEKTAGKDVGELYNAIRAFKAQTSNNFDVPDVTFEDIGGYDRVKVEILRALKLIAGSFEGLSPKLQRELIPRGFIFHGPPGTGKTLFAKAIANQMNATIQVVSGPEVTDMYVGESERKVRELFAEARRNAPAVLVFDEFDSIASQRSGRNDGGSRAGNAIVTQILTEMDGFRPDVPMLVIGTTNRIDIVDEALLRPSRFQAISIDLPDQSARRAIAAVHARHFGIELVDGLLDVLAGATSGFNGDEIRSLFRDALVGMKCEEPAIAADAQRFGQLVGRIRMGHEQRAAQASRRREAAPIRQNERPQPSGPMVEMTPSPPEGDAEASETRTH